MAKHNKRPKEKSTKIAYTADVIRVHGMDRDIGGKRGREKEIKQK